MACRDFPERHREAVQKSVVIVLLQWLLWELASFFAGTSRADLVCFGTPSLDANTVNKFLIGMHFLTTALPNPGSLGPIRHRVGFKFVFQVLQMSLIVFRYITILDFGVSA